jgi:(p)ppGpp synthase/HD superfamily hydrolase
MLSDFDLVLRQACRFMAEKHTVNRKREINGIAMPYFFHPEGVAQLVWKWGAGTPRNLLASIGHDGTEDCGLTEAQIICGFIKGIDPIPSMPLVDRFSYVYEAAKIITELSFLPPNGISKDEEKRLKDEYIRTFDKKSIDAFVIKLADRLCNCMDYKMSDPRYALKYFRKAQFLFDTLSHRCEEIEAAFGERVYDNICSTYQACLIQLVDDQEYGIAMP